MNSRLLAAYAELDPLIPQPLETKGSASRFERGANRFRCPGSFLRRLT